MCRPIAGPASPAREWAARAAATLFAVPLLAATPVLGAPVHAQVVDAGGTESQSVLPAADHTLIGLERQLDSLLGLAERLDARVRAEKERYDASTEATLEAPVERVVGGGLRVRALPRDIEAAASLYEAVWAEVFAPAFGPPPAAIAAAPVGYYDQRGGWNPRIAEGDGMRYSVQVRSGWDDARPQAIRAVMSVILREGPVSIYRWLGQGGLVDEEMWISGFDPRATMLDARRQLAADRSLTNAACLEGEVDACMMSHGLHPDGRSVQDVARSWYDQEELRRVVGGYQWYRRRGLAEAPGTLDAADFFTAQRTGLTVPEGASIEDADIVVLDGTEIFYDAVPATAPTRMTLFMHAVARGGDAAVARWLALPKHLPLERSLEAIAQEPIDRLVEGWRARLGADEGQSNRRIPLRATLTWVALLGMLSMTSTRWRLGR